MTRLTPVAEQALTNNFVYSLRLTVKLGNGYLFEVFKEDKSSIVNLKEPICTCNRFQKDEMPCGHALVVMKENPTIIVHITTQQKYYDATVYLVGKQQHWELLDFFKDIIVLPPFERLKAGRPKKRRIIAAWEAKKKNKYSKCRQRGHNRKTCRVRPPRS
ncbi:uncharacterized protein LOC133779486 [Humulus lupulus]|uniref:uncharacterized protein LOC133779486 n=1 Tax=Humulus lupulus TaxID=3486 RepID=UPI002B40666D|nr:uncharacterized protein LOC133779486 [Humulus lupulus]